MLDAYDDQLKTRLQQKFTLKDYTPDVDLGVLTLLPAKPNINETIRQSQADGAMGDDTKNYGRQLNAWHIVDARGVDKNVQLSDFQGKWLIVHFWALNQFEVVAICVDHNGEIESLADVERALMPIVENVWNGKQLPFPILLHPSMTTLERFGVPGYQTLLVDPEGRFVKGDEKTLAKQLAAKTHWY